MRVTCIGPLEGTLTIKVFAGLRNRRHSWQRTFHYEFEPKHTYLPSTNWQASVSHSISPNTPLPTRLSNLRTWLMWDTLRQLLTRFPKDRLSASAFQHSTLFDNILMNSIKFLDSFPEKTMSEKQSFLRGFVAVLPQFSDRVQHRKVCISKSTS